MNSELKNIIICHHCQTPNKKKHLQENEAAYCATCESFLYSNDPLLLQKLFAFSLSALIFFTIANIYPIVAINISGLQGELTLLEAILRLFDEEFVFVSFFSLLVLFIFPLLLMVLLFCYAFLMLFFPLCTLSKNILIAISVVRRWSMLDIFFIAILVALIKIYEYSSIYFGPAFWSLAIFIIIEIYLVRMQPIDMLWSIWEERCEVS